MKLPVQVIDSGKEGYLYLRAEGSSSWKKYWFVLGRFSLSWYKSKKDLKERGSIPLAGCSLQSLAKEKKNNIYSFEIKNATRVNYLGAVSPPERVHWMKVLQQTILFIEGKDQTNQGHSNISQQWWEQVNSDLTQDNDEFNESSLEDNNPSYSGDYYDYQDDNYSHSSGLSSHGSKASKLASKTKQSLMYSLTKEKLLLAYRYMKSKLEDQDQPPTIIFIPPGVIYRRFGFGLAIQKLAKANPSLHTLQFTDSQYVGDFSLELIEVSKSNTWLNALVFISSQGNKSECRNLASLTEKLPPHIQSLTFDNIFSSQGLTELLEGLLKYPHQITSLKIPNHPLEEYHILLLIQAIKNLDLDTIGLHNTNLGDKQACVIFNTLDSEKEPTICLRELDVSKNHITRASADTIKDFILSNANGTLTSLDLSQNNLGQEGLNQILYALTGPKQRLKKLSLEGSKIGHSSVTALAELLQYNNSLTYLDLSNNKFKDDSAKVLSLAMQQNQKLQFFGIDAQKGGFFSSPINYAHLLTFDQVTARNKALFAREKAKARTRRTVEDFSSDYKNSLNYLLKLLNIDKTTFMEIKNSDKMKFCEECASKCFYSGYQRELVQVLASGERLMMGPNHKFLYFAAVMLSLNSDLLKQKSCNYIAETVKEGYLFKRGGRTRKNWKRLWFTLKGLFIFYYPSHENKKRKGVIVLEDALIREGVRSPSSKFAFQVITSNRVWVLSSNTEEEMYEWIEAIQQAIENKENMVLRSQLEEVRNNIIAFCDNYTKTFRYRQPDLHLKWIMQWWLPQCLEVSAFCILGGTELGRTTTSTNLKKKVDGASFVSIFVNNTAIALYLLTGDYLCDAQLSRVMNANRLENLQFDNIDQLEQRNSEERFYELKFVIWELHKESDEYFADNIEDWAQILFGEVVDKDDAVGLKEPRTFTISKSLMQSHDLQAILWPVLSHLETEILEKLLFLKKQRINKRDSETEVQQIKPVSHLFDFLPMHSENLFNLQTEPATKGTIIITAGEGVQTIERFVVNLAEAPEFTELYQPMKRFLAFLPILVLAWPQMSHSLNKGDIFVATRLVGTLFAFHKKVTAVNISMIDYELYDYWLEYGRLSRDIVLHLGMSATQGFGISSPCVYEPIKWLFGFSIHIIQVMTCKDEFKYAG